MANIVISLQFYPIGLKMEYNIGDSYSELQRDIRSLGCYRDSNDNEKIQNMICCAYPSWGKTSAAVRLAKHWIRDKHRHVILSTSESAILNTCKMLKDIGLKRGIDFLQLVSGGLSDRNHVKDLATYTNLTSLADKIVVVKHTMKRVGRVMYISLWDKDLREDRKKVCLIVDEADWMISNNFPTGYRRVVMFCCRQYEIDRYDFKVVRKFRSNCSMVTINLKLGTCLSNDLKVNIAEVSQSSRATRILVVTENESKLSNSAIFKLTQRQNSIDVRALRPKYRDILSNSGSFFFVADYRNIEDSLDLTGVEEVHILYTPQPDFHFLSLVYRFFRRTDLPKAIDLYIYCFDKQILNDLEAYFIEEDDKYNQVIVPFN